MPKTRAQARTRSRSPSSRSRLPSIASAVRRAARYPCSTDKSRPTLPSGGANVPSGFNGPCPDTYALLPSTRTSRNGSVIPGGGLTAFGNTRPIDSSFAAINGTAAPLAGHGARPHEEPDCAAEADDDLRDDEPEPEAVRVELCAFGDESIDAVRAEQQQHEPVHQVPNVPRHRTPPR